MYKLPVNKCKSSATWKRSWKKGFLRTFLEVNLIIGIFHCGRSRKSTENGITKIYTCKDGWSALNIHCAVPITGNIFINNFHQVLWIEVWMILVSLNLPRRNTAVEQRLMRPTCPISTFMQILVLISIGIQSKNQLLGLFIVSATGLSTGLKSWLLSLLHMYTFQDRSYQKIKRSLFSLKNK